MVSSYQKIGRKMSWEDLGVQDPGLVWQDDYQDWHTNKLGDLFEKTYCEIEDFQDSIDDMLDMGLFESQLEDFKNWIDYIEQLLEEASMDLNPRSKLINTRIQLYGFRKHFDWFAIQIDWF